MKAITDRVLEWISNRPIWITYAIQDIISGKKITEKRIEEYAEICIKEVKKSTQNKAVIKVEQLGGNKREDAFSILSIYDVKNVNAIDSVAKLKFGEKGITAVYGNNGSGKSGYVRSLKKACGATNIEDIHGNIFSQEGNGKPSCIVLTNNNPEPLICDLSSKGESPLKGIEIFDTLISQAYIGETRGASYEPWIFSVLSYLGQIADMIKQKLQNMGNAIEISFPIPPKELEEQDLILAMQKINAKSKMSEFEIIWGENAQKDFEEEEKLLNNSSTEKSIDITNTKSRNLNTLLGYLDNLKQYYAEEHISNINSIQNELAEILKEKVIIENLFTNECDSFDSSSIKMGSWRKLWEYAREYSDEIRRIIPDANENICPLCHQNLQGKELSRFKSIDKFIHSKVNSNIYELSSEFKTLIKPQFTLIDKQTQELLMSNCNLKMEDKDVIVGLLNRTRISIIEVQDIDITIEKMQQPYTEIDITDAENFIKKTIGDCEKELKQYKTLQNIEQREKLENEVLTYKSKKFIDSYKEQIKMVIIHKIEIEDITKAISLVSTNAITSLTKELAEDFLTKEYEERFNRELELLTAGKLKVKLVKAKGGKAKIPFKIVVVNDNGGEFKPNDILSEGERRVVSLAAFFADISNGYQYNPLIFDDPISSLDYDYEGKTVSRLVNLAKERQVIVFTHRISLVYELNADCKKMNVEFEEFSINSVSDKKGVIGPGILTKYKVNSRMGTLLQNQLPPLKKISILDSMYLTLQIGLGANFRNIVEKSIEDILLCGVAQRYDRDIHSKNVIRLAKITRDDCKIVDDMMTKYSIYDHSQPMETPVQPVVYKELYDDFFNFNEWIIEASSRLA